jgi:GAF domain-containing protein
LSVPQYRELAARFARLGPQIGAASTPGEALALVTAAGTQAIENVSSAGVTWGRKGSFETLAATSELANQVDKIQYELLSGPCVDAAVEEHVFVANDLRRERRWPEFAARAVSETGVLAMLAVRMFFEDADVVASLNLYATRVDAFDEQAEMTALILATHAALAAGSLQRLERIENLERALASNRDIGVAMGILMDRHLVTREQAFDLLRVVSQHTHRKLVDVAASVIDAGELELPAPHHVKQRPASA